MTRVHREMATCNGIDCPETCHFRALMRDEPEKWGAYLDPNRPTLTVHSERPACAHLGHKTGETGGCQGCGDNARPVPLFRCALHGECTQTAEVPGARCCAKCGDYSPARPADPGAIYVQATHHSNGIGDHAILLLTVPALQAENPGKRIVLHTDRADCVPWVRLWWRDVTTAPIPAGAKVLQPLDERPMGRKAKTRWEHARDRAGVSALQIPPLCHLPREVIEAIWRFQGHVILCPEANSVDRPWPLPAWMDLENRLIERGIPCVAIGTKAANLTRFRSVPYVSQEPARVAALLRMAGCVVGNDSGMVHLAGLLGTPAVALCGLVGGYRVFGGYRTVRWIDGPLPCNGCEWVDPERSLYNCQQCASLGMIRPEQVAEMIEAAVCRPAWDYTLLPPGPRAALARAARETAHLDGAIAELGVRRGGSSLIMSDNAPGKRLHLFDTWEGMPVDDPDGGNNDKGKHAAPQSDCETLLAGRDYACHCGIFPATAAGLEDERYACVHLDADHYAPTIAAIHYFWPRLAVGGKIVFDDWKRGDCPGIERAVRERFSDAQIEDSAEYQCTVTKRG